MDLWCLGCNLCPYMDYDGHLGPCIDLYTGHNGVYCK